jgi:syntaxin 16
MVSRLQLYDGQELARMHDDHITKPSFDGEMEQEQEIEILTSNITSLFHKCQKLIQVLNRKGKQTPSAQQKRLAGNVVSSIAKDVQTLSMDFRKSQSTYLRRR